MIFLFSLSDSMIKLMDKWSNVDYFFSKNPELIKNSILAGEFLGGVFFVFVIAWAYLKPLLSGGHKGGRFVDIERILEALVIFGCIAIAPYITEYLAWIAERAVHYLGSPAETMAETSKAMIESAGDPTLPSGEKVGDVSAWKLLWSSSLTAVIMNSVNTTAAVCIVVIRFLMLLVSKFLTIFLILTCPVAIAFTIFPFTRSTFARWLGAFINVLFVTYTLHLLDTMFFTKIITDVYARIGTTNLIASTCLNFTFLIMYLLTFSLTALYTGGSAVGGQVMSILMGAGSWGIASAFTAIRGAGFLARGAAKGVSTVGDVLKAGKDAIK